MAAAILVAAAALFIGRRAIEESFQIRRLSSRDPSVRKAAGGRLREIGGARAILRLCEVIEGDPGKDAEPLASLQAHPLFGVLQALREAARTALAAMGEVVEESVP